MIDHARRLRISLSAVRGARHLHAHDGWDAQRLARHQRRRLLELVQHAAARSPYYRERFAGIDLDDGDLRLASLPVLDKATMVERFDEIVADRRLTKATLERHLERFDVERGDPLLFGEYRVMASSGSSGQRGLFAYSRREWLQILAGLLRWNNFYLKMAPRLPPRRVAMVAADSPLHMTGRLARSLDAGGAKILRLDARTPLEEVVQALNAFQPESLTAYASVASLLAGQQLAGTLRIAPKIVVTTSEVCTAEMQQRILTAWKVCPFNSYSSTETGMLAGDCDRHAGLHVFEDQVQIEVVDDEHQPVAPGEPGRLLITNLFNCTQPLIRYELNDLVTLSTGHCACGRPFPLLEAVDGRCDDILELSAIAGGTVKVHPLTLQSPLATIASLAEYRIVCAPGELRVEAVLDAAGQQTHREIERGLDAAAQQTCLEIEKRIAAALAKRGVKPLPIRVQAVSAIPRNPVSGKHKAVEMQTV